MPDASADPSAQKSRRKASKLDAYRHLVGKVSDSEVARKAGVTSSGVAKYRRTHGIPAAATANAEAEALPPEPGEEAASKKAKPAKAKARKKRGATPRRTSKLDRFREHIGVKTDREVAQLAGLTRNAVQMYRRKNGIPPARPPGAAVRPTKGAAGAAPRKLTGRRSRIDPVRDLVGKVTDREVASAAGVTVNAVQLYRKKYGIPPAPRGAAAVATAVQAREAVRAAQLYGWRLRLEGPGGAEIVRFVVAADAAGACAAAKAAGTTVHLERLGEAIG